MKKVKQTFLPTQKMPSLSDCCRKHILRGRPLSFSEELRRIGDVHKNGLCSQNFPHFIKSCKNFLIYLLIAAPHRYLVISQRERIHITLKQAILYGLLPGFGSPKQGLQLDGYWYYLSTPTPPESTLRGPSHSERISVLFFF